MKGLAYVDFSDDSHLAAAMAKNRQALLGRKLSIARSNPKHGKRDSSGRSLQGAQGRPSYYTMFACFLVLGISPVIKAY